MSHLIFEIKEQQIILCFDKKPLSLVSERGGRLAITSCIDFVVFQTVFVEGKLVQMRAM